MQNKGPKLSLHLAFDVSFSEHASQHLRPLHTGTATVRPAQRQCKTRDQNYQRTWHLMSASLSMPASISDLSTLVVPTNTGRPVFTIRLISVTTAVHLPACSQPVSQPASQPVCQPASQSLSQPVNSVCQSVSQSVSQSVCQSVNKSVRLSVCQSATLHAFKTHAQHIMTVLKKRAEGGGGKEDIKCDGEAGGKEGGGGGKEARGSTEV